MTVYENGRRDLPIWFTYKSPEELSSQQQSYLQNAMQAIDNAVYASNKNDITPLANLVDLDVLARYYIANELLDDTESFHGSCYLNRDRGADCKWKFGPVWDFGNGFSRGNSNKFIWQDPIFHQVWIGEIYKSPAFRDIVISVWREWLGKGNEKALINKINAMADNLAAAAACDAARWPQYGNADELAAAGRFRGLLEQRIAWLKQQWGESGIEDITADTDNDLTVTPGAGMITIISGRPAKVRLSTLSGQSSLLNVQAGATDVALPAGFYIVEGQKVIVK